MKRLENLIEVLKEGLDDAIVSGCSSVFDREYVNDLIDDLEDILHEIEKK